MADRNTDITIAIPALVEATMFAAGKHRTHRRKDAEETPYINHPIMVANLTDIMESPPARWTLERRRQYVAWSKQVVNGCRGHNVLLEKAYDARVVESIARLI
jgi:(p)ppGpp synthase/HD superfamily hydrolase